MSKELRSAESELRVKADEKDLLQSRHDALTNESAGLQLEMAKAKRKVRELEEALDEERQHAAQNENLLRAQHKSETDLLTDQIDSLHRAINAKESQHAADEDDRRSEQRKLEGACQKAEERANGLQRTVNKLQEVEGTLSSREMKMQEALDSEKQRHRQEEGVLVRQIEELNSDSETKREASETMRNELNNAKEELRISIREQATLKEKIEELEEEIEVLQANLEEEAQYAESQRNQNTESVEARLQKTEREKQALQDQLASVNIELHNARQSLQKAEAEKSELEAKLRIPEKPTEGTFDVDLEKRELRRIKQKLEKDLARVKAEKDCLSETNKALEQEINAEIEHANAEEHRLCAEIDVLRHKQVSSTDARDRELTSAKNKIQRLETRIRELEGLLDDRSHVVPPPGPDVTI